MPLLFAHGINDVAQIIVIFSNADLFICHVNEYLSHRADKPAYESLARVLNVYTHNIQRTRGSFPQPPISLDLLSDTLHQIFHPTLVCISPMENILLSAITVFFSLSKSVKTEINT